MPINYKIKVIPRSSEIRVVEVGNGGIDFRIYVTSVPENNGANLQTINILSKYLNISKSHIKITKGLKGSNKTIEVV